MERYIYQVLWESSAREDFLEEVTFDVDPEGWIAVKVHTGDKWMERGFLCKKNHHEGKYQGIQGWRCVENDVMDVYPLYYPDCSSVTSCWAIWSKGQLCFYGFCQFLQEMWASRLGWMEDMTLGNLRDRQRKRLRTEQGQNKNRSGGPVTTAGWGIRGQERIHVPDQLRLGNQTEVRQSQTKQNLGCWPTGTYRTLTV